MGLGEKMDELNVLINKFEDRLINKGAGVRASVLLFSEEQVHGQVQHYLVFGKLANQWRLIWERYNGDKPLGSSPLKDAAMDIRFKAVDLFADLVAALDAERAAREELATEQVEKLRSFLDDWDAGL